VSASMSTAATITSGARRMRRSHVGGSGITHRRG
jgi:hypothetical protein